MNYEGHHDHNQHHVHLNWEANQSITKDISTISLKEDQANAENCKKGTKQILMADGEY